MNDTVILEYLHRLEDKVDKASEKLYQNSAIIESHTEKLNSIESQTIRTNGRVTSLENTVSKLSIIETQNSGIIAASQMRLRALEDAGTLDRGSINKLDDIVKHDQQYRTEDTRGKRETFREILKHVITAIVTLLASFLGIQLINK